MTAGQAYPAVITPSQVWHDSTTST
jgi:hypothetical protein